MFLCSLLIYIWSNLWELPFWEKLCWFFNAVSYDWVCMSACLWYLSVHRIFMKWTYHKQVQILAWFCTKKGKFCLIVRWRTRDKANAPLSPQRKKPLAVRAMNSNVDLYLEQMIKSCPTMSLSMFWFLSEVFVPFLWTALQTYNRMKALSCDELPGLHLES